MKTAGEYLRKTMAAICPHLFLVATCLMLVSANEVLVNMDEGSDSTSCDGVYLLNHTSEVRVLSRGKAPGGYCGVTVYTSADEVKRYTCDGLCVTFRSSSLSTCEMKVKFTGHYFNKDGDVSKLFDCRNSAKQPWCMDVNSMRVEVIESYQYAYQWSKRLYDFDFDVSPRCTRDKRTKTVYSAQRQRLEEEERQTYIEGLMVGLCLACVFLVILFIMYCYYKHKAVNNTPEGEDVEQEAPKKGNIFTTFRAKLPIGRGRASSRSPEGAYKKTGNEETVQCRPSGSGHPQSTAPLREETRPLTSGDSTYELANETAKPVDSGNDSASDNAGNGTVSDTPTVVVNSGSQEKIDELSEKA